MSESKGVSLFWLVLAVALFGAVMLWGYLDENHYFYHDKIAHIASGTWDGKAKECDSTNAKAAQPVLQCDAGHSDVQEAAPVRFYGDTRIDGAPDSVTLHWKCEKNQNSQPAVTCRINSTN